MPQFAGSPINDDALAALEANLSRLTHERNALAAEIDRTRHEYVTKDGIRNCAHVLRFVCGEFPYYCCQTVGAVKHKTSAVILAALREAS